MSSTDPISTICKQLRLGKFRVSAERTAEFHTDLEACLRSMASYVGNCGISQENCAYIYKSFMKKCPKLLSKDLGDRVRTIFVTAYSVEDDPVELTKSQLKKVKSTACRYAKPLATYNLSKKTKGATEGFTAALRQIITQLNADEDLEASLERVERLVAKTKDRIG